MLRLFRLIFIIYYCTRAIYINHYEYYYVTLRYDWAAFIRFPNHKCLHLCLPVTRFACVRWVSPHRAGWKDMLHLPVHSEAQWFSLSPTHSLLSKAARINRKWCTDDDDDGNMSIWRWCWQWWWLIPRSRNILNPITCNTYPNYK